MISFSPGGILGATFFSNALNSPNGFRVQLSVCNSEGRTPLTSWSTATAVSLNHYSNHLVLGSSAKPALNTNANL
eukprot:8557124-Pyramimonas_sp.AAC.1